MQSFVEVRALVAVITLAEELNFTRAAKRLGISQSGLSRQVSSLERKYNLKLFDRNHANVYLTEAGRMFVEEAKLSLQHDERALQAARAVTEGVEHVLKIGRSPYADPFWPLPCFRFISRCIRSCESISTVILLRTWSTVCSSRNSIWL